MKDTRIAYYDNGFCYRDMRDEDAFNECCYDIDDLCHYDYDYVMEGIEDASKYDLSFCYGVWVEPVEGIENASPNGDSYFHSDLTTNGTSSKNRDHGNGHANEHKSKRLAKKEAEHANKSRKSSSNPKGKKSKKGMQHKAPQVGCTREARGNEIVHSGKVELEVPKLCNDKVESSAPKD